MILDSLALHNFRNYHKAEARFSSRLNILYGLNAHGKTNFLEAIYLLCLGRSFRAAKNQELLNHEAPYFLVQGRLIQDNQIEKVVAIKYIKDGKKEISIDRKRLSSHARLFGQFPVVVMAPDEFRITAGAPSERRRFLDILLSQVSLSYLGDLQEYTRILKQRNKILHEIREGRRVAEESLEPWSENLIAVGSRVIAFRRRFIADFAETLKDIYTNFAAGRYNLDVFMESSVLNEQEETTAKAFRAALDRRRQKERVLGVTMVGPHRDDVVFTIDGQDLRKYGSRGEHKTVLFSVKMAEFHYLHNKRQETPILLLDDCYSELDNERERNMLATLEGAGQIFLTSPKADRSSMAGAAGKRDERTFFVDRGQIEHVNEV